jgi:TetR/AcrR family transcriptional regulator, transcriptional repressor for nem operon
MMVVIFPKPRRNAMDKTPSRRELSHDRIVEAAARAVRRGGYAGTGVAEIMSDAGLTHGGFYAHFESRDALLAAAVTRAARDNAAYVDRGLRRRRKGVSALRAVIEGYLNEAHLASAETGCVISALSSEIPRQSSQVRDASAACTRALIDRVRQSLPARAKPGDAQVIASTLVGALQLARAVGDAKHARAVLKSARVALLAQYDLASRAALRKGTS